jgi:hypothetical protein
VGGYLFLKNNMPPSLSDGLKKFRVWTRGRDAEIDGIPKKQYAFTAHTILRNLTIISSQIDKKVEFLRKSKQERVPPTQNESDTRAMIGNFSQELLEQITLGYKLLDEDQNSASVFANLRRHYLTFYRAIQEADHFLAIRNCTPDQIRIWMDSVHRAGLDFLEACDPDQLKAHFQRICKKHNIKINTD